MKDYIINNNTLYVEQNENKLIIYELSTEKIIENMGMRKFLDNSCLFYGSSLEGKLKGTKALINEDYKLPVILSERKQIVIFPLKEKDKEVCWINYKQIENYIQISKSKVLVEFKGGLTKVFHASFYSFHKQILKCCRLLVVYNSRNQ